MNLDRTSQSLVRRPPPCLVQWPVRTAAFPEPWFPTPVSKRGCQSSIVSLSLSSCRATDRASKEHLNLSYWLPLKMKVWCQKRLQAFSVTVPICQVISSYRPVVIHDEIQIRTPPDATFACSKGARDLRGRSRTGCGAPTSAHFLDPLRHIVTTMLLGRSEKWSRTGNASPHSFLPRRPLDLILQRHFWQFVSSGQLLLNPTLEVTAA